jgi:hypothetical protein
LVSNVKGGCLCGRVRYEIAADPLAVVTCHCIHCQKQSGAAFSLVVAVPRDALQLTGSLATYEDQGTSGQPVYRRFCGKCGSPVLTDTPRARDDGVIFVKGGTVDDAAELLVPSLHYWTERQHAWLELPAHHQRLRHEETSDI